MRSLSGIQASGVLHIGNYFGAIKQFVENQEKNEGLYFIADYHALTSLRDPKAVRENTLNAAMDFLALGLDPEKSIIFVQSDVPEHTELMWILMNITPVGLLERAVSYKEKVEKGLSPNAGLLTYPVLMAADILMYDPDIVPVGKDQKQHIEMARDIATKFNGEYGETFKLPEEETLKEVAVVPGTDGQKMSKSYGNTIQMFATKAELKKQVMSIVTDSTPLEEPKDPENNITKLYELFATKEELAEMKRKFSEGGYGYGHGKTELLNKILEYFGEARAKREELVKNPEYLEEVLRKGAKKARAMAIEKLKEVKKAVGLIGDVYKD
ncbi:MAG: tryptophan--tRNA ligase [Fusobacteriaceae bacterium]|jgi:tryptophanyl-tRNA synthetase|nr:tryptophan--tRNA ligase [Fusobacteriaceae bacterium]MBP6467191.1 tryptophan--tRNA ligase [Fusobacteriaceae bacterium]MBP9596438.1 tryptophan--tRNA ligase [Fusobacteriaceae bacterium]MBU9917806.1 tryptophan--tRNA ligase [Fusobacteriaceae bacterium]